MSISTKVIFDIFGVYTHGKLVGKVNPKAKTTVTMYGESVKDCIGKIRPTEALYKIVSVSQHEFSGSHA